MSSPCECKSHKSITRNCANKGRHNEVGGAGMINISSSSTVPSIPLSGPPGREVSVEFALLLGSLIALVTAVGVLANALVVVAILGDAKMRRSPMNLLLLNLAVADLLYLLAFTPFWTSMTVHGDGGWHFPEAFCPIGRYLSNVLLLVSIFTYFAVCVERFVAIVHPMQAPMWCTRSRIWLAVFGTWTFAMAFQFPYLALFQTQPAPWSPELRVCRSRGTKSTAWRTFKWAEFVLSYAIPVVLSALLYARICRVLWASNSYLHKNSSGSGGSASTFANGGNSTIGQSSARTIRRVLETKLEIGIHQVADSSAVKKPPAQREANLRARRSVVKMLMAFFICYTPMVVYFLWNALFGRPLPLPFEFVLLTSTLVQFQSAFNPFLYTLFASQFREKVHKLFRRNSAEEHRKASGKSTTSSTVA